MMTVVIASGYFSPIHVGHLDYLQAAKELGDQLIVIVNNDEQLRLKTWRPPFMVEQERLAVVRALRCVDIAVLSIDRGPSVCKTLASLRGQLPASRFRLVFANGGDVSDRWSVREASLCRLLGIELAVGVGGSAKRQSSSWLIAGVRPPGV